MIPLIDDYLQVMIAKNIKWLKEHPAMIEHIFKTGRRETLQSLKDFLLTTKIKVILGYPRQETSLPAYVIMLSPENEQPAGLGDNYEFFEESSFGFDYEDEAEQKVAEVLPSFISSTYMNATYRIECWSDNADLSTFMYTILKWCLWVSRHEMLEMGWNTIKVSGADSDPVPDYLPVFVYRRTASLNLLYEAFYYENLEDFDKYFGIFDRRDEYELDARGNLIGPDGEILIPSRWMGIIHYYKYGKKEPYYTKKYNPDLELVEEEINDY